MNNKTFLLGVGFNKLTIKEVLEFIKKGLEKKEKKYYIVTPNPEILVIAHDNHNYKKVLNEAKLALPDGIGIMIAAKLLSKDLKERIPGVDLVESICKEVSKQPITVGFLGSGPHVAEIAADCLREKYPGLDVVFTAEEWGQVLSNQFNLLDREKIFSAKKQSSDHLQSTGDNSFSVLDNTQSKQRENSDLPDVANSKQFLFDKKNGNNQLLNGKEKIDILFVAFGSPKQEIWISENLEKLPVKVAIGVGGAFDFISGKVPRAPKVLRSLGLEWLFRLIVQPWRIKRQLKLLKFIYLVIKEKLIK